MRQIIARKNLTEKTPRTVGDLVAQRRCPTFLPHEYVSAILPALQGREAGVAGVLDTDGELIGLLTEREILRRLFEKAGNSALSPAALADYMRTMMVEEAMIEAPATLDEDMDFEAAAAEMLRRGHRYMPVVSRIDSAHLLGIVSEHEVAEALHKRLEETRRIEAQHRSLLSYMLYEPYGTGFQMQDAD
jgi:Mg/Co/Ni transporter MgtE